MTEGAKLNTDRELYREPTESFGMEYYANSLHVTAEGTIGMNVGGLVIVLAIAKWHDLARVELDGEKRGRDLLQTVEALERANAENERLHKLVERLQDENEELCSRNEEFVRGAQGSRMRSS